MRILKKLFYLFLMIGITFLACQAKVKKLSPDEEIRLLKNLVKEKTEAAQAEMEYWQKMDLVGGLIDAQVAEVNEKQISPEAFNGLKDLKDPLFDLLASSERIGIKKLRERYDAAKKALEKYAENYIEDHVKEPETVSTEKPVSIESETVIVKGEEVGIPMGMPPTPELPPLVSPEEREEVFEVKEESMQIQPEVFEEIPPTPPSPGAMGIPAAPGMAPPSMGMTPEEAPSMGMEPEPVPEMGEVEEEVEEAEPVGMGMEEAVATAPMAPGTEVPELPAPLPVPAMPEVLPAEPAGMGMTPEEVPSMGMEPEPVPEMGEVEEEVEEAEPVGMGMEEEPVGMTLGIEPPGFTGLESFEKYENLNLAMNSVEDLSDIEDDEEEIQDEEDEEESEDDM